MATIKKTKNRRIGVIATRLAGTDGVSLETDKWIEVLERTGHTCFYLTGDCNKPAEKSMIVDEAHFKHPEIAEIYRAAFSEYKRRPEITKKINRLKDFLKEKLYQFTRQFKIELLLVENALAIPMNIPLGLALTEFIAETNFRTIAHDHDLYWERKRFLVNCIWDYLDMAFPPRLPSIRHVVINTSAANQLSLRTGASTTIIPNVLDFDKRPALPDAYTSDLRQALSLTPGELFFLQPTRVVQRKGIEHAIEFTRRINRSASLIISHFTSDEGDGYLKHLQEYAGLLSVNVIYGHDIISSQRGMTGDHRKVYSLGDVYLHADLVTYPSTIEGFGNAFLEAIYYGRPILVNNYSIFSTDIKPKGFRVIEFDGYITDTTIEIARRVLDNPSLREEMAEHNYRLGKRHYSFSMLERRLETVLAERFGEEI
jgi:glycosyltransferase involved in cell wall biosynthesis